MLNFELNIQNPNFSKQNIFMKKIIFGFLALGVLTAAAQPGKKGKDAHMEPVLAAGYYIPLKGDTVKGEVQTNRENDAAGYKTILFKPKNSPKVVELTPKKVKAYGYDDNHFVGQKMGEEDVYFRYMERGRLVLMEYKFAKVEEGVEKYPSIYFVQDTKAAGDDKHNTKDLNEIPQKPPGHKKLLKNFFADQPIILDGIDKWYFKIDEIRKAVVEFNKMYSE